ncbi:transcriptional regulator with XRE-family HTH domain [Salinibacter ruber]|uniref:helix-turn-helix transcriptional regulator n=1 Tax=Salinibacter ruber TaxID=146919 RepID=UPI0021689E16|nr:helix-turn-helix transcriptional regulator [Salinibacter ruber]MCS3667397.1 transcriptional regulator with XRE-family HTH domain [Salinibacter ruber]
MSVSEMTQGEEIRKLRDKAGLTQKQAAERLDMNERTYGSYERDERDISYKQMKKIRRELGGRVENVKPSTYDTHVKRYPVADSGKSPTSVYVDAEIIPMDSMPDKGTAHYVNSRWMGPWMDSDLVLAREVDRIDGPGRYVVRWAEGSDKVVVEAWRHSESKICVRFHAPERRVLFEEVGFENGATIFRREDGSEISVDVLGIVVFPDSSTQMMTEGMADTAARIVNGGGGVNREPEKY